MDSLTERRRKRLGRHAERLAALLLRAHGVRILARNLRVPGGCEVDILGRQGDTLVLCEVKARRAGGAVAAVDARRLRALERSAQALLVRREHGWARRARVEVVAFDGWRVRRVPARQSGPAG